MIRTSLCSLCLGTILLSLTGCAEDPEDSVLATAAQPLLSCSDNPGKWQTLANLAVAVASELGELRTHEQFQIVSKNGAETVVLSDSGQATCSARGGCAMVEALLGLQELPNDTFVSQSVFNTIDYRISLVAMYRQQVQQIAQYVANRRTDLLPEAHSLTLLGQAGIATCGSPWYAFRVTQKSSALPLQHPATLCEAFWTFGGTASCGGNNPYIDFAVIDNGSTVKIDPTDYNSGGITTTTSGSCISSIPYASTTYSVGKCCYYKGVYGTLQKTTSKPNTYYCKI